MEQLVDMLSREQDVTTFPSTIAEHKGDSTFIRPKNIEGDLEPDLQSLVEASSTSAV